MLFAKCFRLYYTPTQWVKGPTKIHTETKPINIQQKNFPLQAVPANATGCKNPTNAQE